MAGKYKTSIPSDAKRRVVKRHADWSPAEVEHRVGRAVVGFRHFNEAGEMFFEYGQRDGERHGVEYHWGDPAHMVSAIPYANGVLHGTARQWDHDGVLLGTYRIVRGTGLDLWRQRREDGSIYLAEVFHWRKGRADGFEWWINEDQASVHIERHWRDWQLHGIERQWWNEQGRLSRGYPKYHVQASPSRGGNTCGPASRTPPCRRSATRTIGPSDRSRPRWPSIYGSFDEQRWPAFRVRVPPEAAGQRHVK